MAQVVLNPAGIKALAREIMPASVTQHVWVGGETKTGLLPARAMIRWNDLFRAAPALGGEHEAPAVSRPQLPADADLVSVIYAWSTCSA